MQDDTFLLLAKAKLYAFYTGVVLHVYHAYIENGANIDYGQDQPSFYLYPHLSDAVIGKGTYAGDAAFGIKL